MELPARWQRRQAPAGSQHPGTQRRAEWYDPRCRGWYQDARETKDVIFTAPYTDANSGLLVMTAAAPIYLDPDTKENVSAAAPFASPFQASNKAAGTSLSESSPSTFRLRTWTRRSSARRSAMATLI